MSKHGDGNGSFYKNVYPHIDDAVECGVVGKGPL
uniref:Uncharacterized protein n=1 Tax=Pithovirus LCPAC304 TaxID=2506594 RepID=A0A481Z897_9VIRU|nr:MAG: hypothetical protein LCPAC304_03400 [Pithovirus LCPAC304]